MEKSGLDAIVNLRREEARDKLLIEKAERILNNSGRNSSVFDDETFKICHFEDETSKWSGEYNRTFSITYNGNLVLSEYNREITSYFSGEWEEKLDELYKRSVQAAAIERDTEITRIKGSVSKEEERLRNRFGI